MQDSSPFQYIAIDQISESKTNPRQTFDQAKLEELAASIKHHGLIQPIVVRPKEKGFEVVAGARRFRACQLAEEFSVPAHIRELNDAEAIEWQLIELSEVVKRFLLVPWPCTSWISPRRADFALIGVSISKGYNRMPDDRRDNGRRLAQECIDLCTTIGVGSKSVRGWAPSDCGALLGLASVFRQLLLPVFLAPRTINPATSTAKKKFPIRVTVPGSPIEGVSMNAWLA